MAPSRSARPGRLVALGRAGPLVRRVRDQIDEVEAWARRQRLEVVRPFGPAAARSREHPQVEDVRRAAADGAFDWVGVVDVSRVGSSANEILQTLTLLQRAGVGVAAPSAGSITDNAPFMDGLELAARLEQVFVRERSPSLYPRRRCAPRVHVDLDYVLELQRAGVTLTEIAWQLCVGRATVVRRLARARAEGLLA